MRQPDGIRSAAQVSRLYDRLARFYDALIAPYELIGGRRLQRRALAELELAAGDTVVDLGTGSGWNLPILAETVGPVGRVIGVDLSRGMLERARARADQRGLDNIELVRGDMREYVPPPHTAAVIGAFTMEMVPEHDDVVAGLVRHLPAGARVAVIGMRNPERWPEWLVRLGSLLMRPFGVRPAYHDIQPWTSLRRHLADVEYEEDLLGVLYTARGRVPPAAPPHDS